MNADPRVMEFFPDLLSPGQSDALVDDFEREFSERRFCPWAVELRHSGEFIGFVGLHAVPEHLKFAPGIEVGWRLDRASWGHGYATEAASAAIAYGFEVVGASEIVSFTSALNARSRRVMERLGMVRTPADEFDHPNVPEGHPLRPHVLYRLTKTDWAAGGRRPPGRLS